MKTILCMLAVMLGVGALAVWLGTGASRGWTKTSVPVKQLDAVTGIEAVSYEKRFVPGVDFLGGAWLAAAAMAGVSLFFRNQKQTNSKHITDPMKKQILVLLTLASFAGAGLAAPQSFDFKDPKGVNNAVFKLDAPLEAINGSANGIAGTVTFDPENPGATKGKIVVATDSLHVPNPMMKGHLHGEQWMDVKKYSEISFEAKELKNVKTTAEATTADAVGTLTIRGVAKEATVPVKLTYLKDKLSQRVPNMQGDLLVIRANFQIKRGDFGINPGAPQEKVSDTIDLTLSIAGAAPRS
jgi:polyisoprenoid-binding protein YceI